MFLAALVFARLGCGIIEGLQDNKKEGEEEGKDEHKEESKIANAGNLQLINNPQPTADETATDVPASDEPATDVPTAAAPTTATGSINPTESNAPMYNELLSNPSLESSYQPTILPGVPTPPYDRPRSDGIDSSMIPPGDEDLYILKSEVVPPVCPACPSSSTCPRQKPCRPCPPCARCPEPAFDCKKVPNYRSGNSDFLPRPVLTDFNQFGM